jgi:Zn-finger nucleic acid-binding protein
MRRIDRRNRDLVSSRHMEAGTFHCPSCGAAIAGDSTLCAYCGSQLQSVACASCFGMMFVGSKFCPHCGAAAAVVGHGTAADHPCPRCAEQHLSTVSVAGVALEECPGCGGLWVAAGVFNQICADRATQEAAIAVPLPPVPSGSPVEHSARYLKCPVCAELMNRFQFAERSGVVLDKCRDHGIWFDRDELRRVVEFIRAGGLTVARERDIEELKRQRAGLEMDRVTASTTSESVLGPGRGFGRYADSTSALGWMEAIVDLLWLFK